MLINRMNVSPLLLLFAVPYRGGGNCAEDGPFPNVGTRVLGELFRFSSSSAASLREIGRVWTSLNLVCKDFARILKEKVTASSLDE